MRLALDPWASSIFLSCLVGLRVVQGRHAEANALAARCIAVCQDIEDPIRTAWCLDAIAVTHAAQGKPLRSVHLWERPINYSRAPRPCYRRRTGGFETVTSML